MNEYICTEINVTLIKYLLQVYCPCALNYSECFTCSEFFMNAVLIVLQIWPIMKMNKKHHDRNSCTFNLL